MVFVLECCPVDGDRIYFTLYGPFEGLDQATDFARSTAPTGYIGGESWFEVLAPVGVPA